MAKLSPVYGYRSDGSRAIKGYKISLQKTECEKHGFNHDSQVTIEYLKDTIILKKSEV